MFLRKLKKHINMSHFHPLEAVGRGSGTQLQVGENINYITWRFKGYIFNLTLTL